MEELSEDMDDLLGDGLELLLAGSLDDDAVSAVGSEYQSGQDKALTHSPQVESGQQPSYVNRSKQELAFLRREIVELEAQLVAAKASGKGDGQRQSAQSLWERLASRQKEERLKAEIENDKLKEALDGQLRIAKSLEKVLRKRAASSAVCNWQVKKRRPEVGSSSDSIFSMLSDDLDDVYAAFDDVMRETELGSLRGEMDDAQAKLDAAGELYMELRHAVVVPFDVQRTGDAMWRFLSMTEQEIPNGYMTAAECTSDTIRMKVNVTLRLRRSESLVGVHLLVRRVVEEHRVVLVSSSYGESDGSLFDGKTIKLRESNWTAVEAVNGGEESASVVKTCLRMTPSFAGAGTSKKAHLESMVDLVIASYAQTMKAFVQIIENLLLSKSLSE